MTEDFDKKKQLKAMVIENKTPNTTGQLNILIIIQQLRKLKKR